MSAGERLSFVALFERHPGVTIPILQRDYAQGRAAEAEVRAAFLQALRDALDKPADDETLPLDLDFVYGSIDSGGTFAPLDGQQRLTTLLLLHWYVATRDGHTPDFVNKQLPARGSRFTYATRPSSREFFDSLLHWQPESRRGVTLSAHIADQPWFFLSWKMDPTIQSALTMLDEIDARFSDAEGLYERLTNRDRPAITFQLLDLHDFGLSDDLYIKMNARGKPLTRFETFKAQLEDHVDAVVPSDRFQLHDRQVVASEYIGHRIDTAWADVLWHYRDRQTALFDEGFMNLVRAVAIVTRRPGERSHDTLMDALRDGQQVFSFIRYQEAGCLDEDFTRTFIRLLDAWSGNDAGIRPLLPEGAAFDERAFVERMLKDASRLSYAELLQFSAYCGFLISHPQASAVEFGEWMRVIVNLSSNTPYDRLSDFSRSAQSVRELLSHAPTILSYLASPEAKEVKGFYGQQVREERIKASLLLRNDGWRDALEGAERHRYFAGQIEFLLDFAAVLEDWSEEAGFGWNKEEEANRLERFVAYREKAFAIFTDSGLRVLPEFVWERALLAHGDYMLPSGRNFSFLQNFERDESWKRLLRGSPGEGARAKRRLVQKVLDEIDLAAGVQASLAALVQSRIPDETWRALLVQHPEAISFCHRGYVRRDVGGRLYLLRKVRMSGDHAELLTYVLYLRLRPTVKTTDYVGYQEVDTDKIEPFIYGKLAGRSGRLTVQVRPGETGLSIVVNPGDSTGNGLLPKGFEDEMIAQGFERQAGCLAATVPFLKAEEILVSLVLGAERWDFERGQPT